MRYLRRCRGGHTPATTHGVQPILDGFATGLAALACCRLQPALRDYLIVGHAPPNPPTSTCSPNSASSRCSTYGCGWAKPAAPPSPCRLSSSPPGSSPKRGTSIKLASTAQETHGSAKQSGELTTPETRLHQQAGKAKYQSQN